MSSENVVRQRSTPTNTRLRRGILIVSVLVLLVLMFYDSYTIVHLDEEGKPIGLSGEFDPAVYVDSIWESRVIPTIQEEAVELPVLIEAIETDPEAAKEQYGRQDATAGPYNFLTEGSGRVTVVESGNMLVDLAPYDGDPEVAVRLGPAFTGTEIRDALEFIRFGDFKNVLEYADVSNELNAHVRNLVVNDINKDAIAGQEISFYGAFALRDNSDDIVIIPVVLEVEGS
jgi:predicted lipoprotein